MMTFSTKMLLGVLAFANAGHVAATAYFTVDTGDDLQFGSATRCPLRAALLNIAHQSTVGTLGFANPDCPAGQAENVIEFSFPAGKSGYPEIALDPALGRLKHQAYNVVISGVTIDGERGSGLVLVDGKTAHLTLRNAVLRGGLAATAPDTAGAGILFARGRGLTLVNVRVSECTSADVGGGIAVSAPGDLYMERVHLDGNASRFGGGLFYFGGGKAFIVDSIIENNVAIHGGGVLSGDSMLRIEGSRVRFNVAEVDGGGVHAGALATRLSEFRGNVARGSGGGIFSSLSLTVEDASLSGNRSGSDGGAIAADADVAVTRSGFDANLAGQGGGAIRLGAKSGGHCVSVGNTTFAHNVAASGGALWIAGVPVDASCGMQLVNNTIFGNQGSSQIELAGAEAPAVGDILFANNLVVTPAYQPPAKANCAGHTGRLRIEPEAQPTNTQFPGASCDSPFGQIPVEDLGLDATFPLTGGVFDQVYVPEAAIAFPPGSTAVCFGETVLGIDQFGNARGCKQGAVEAAPVFDFPDDDPPGG